MPKLVVEKSRYRLVVKIPGETGAEFELGRLTPKQAKDKFIECKRFYRGWAIVIFKIVDGLEIIGEFRKYEKIYPSGKKLILARESNEKVVFVYNPFQ